MSSAEFVETTLNFDNSYARDLEGFYVDWKADQVPQPSLVEMNGPLAQQLGLNLTNTTASEWAAIFSGNSDLPGTQPLAQAYAGHQFGGFSPQLGDGRALLLGEVIDRDGVRRDIQLKGSGRTPFSRGGDGKAPMGPVLREFLMAEAMHALGIPTTRALAAVTTGERVVREEELPGAILTRVASSHIRVGTFQFFSVRGDVEKVRQLADYSIARHYPRLRDTEQPYLTLFEAVAEKQAQLIAQWMLVGFVHGVMNTDNMTISGETIDYGPCAFLDVYDPKAVFSSIDVGGRYAYANQPSIAQWNLARFAETLVPLVASDEQAAVGLLTDVLDAFTGRHENFWLDGMRAKLGLMTEEDRDLGLANDLHSAMTGQNVDHTLLFRRLSNAVRGDDEPVRELFDDPAGLNDWLPEWKGRLERETVSAVERATAMDRVNPIYIPRNHKVEEALAAATDDRNYDPFRKMMDVLAQPFDERAEYAVFAQPAPSDFGPFTTICGT
ncbi:MAG: protein adenylyltransferase SelO [Methyloligellaceae bacterium]